MAMTTFAAIDIGSYEISMKIFEFSKKIGFRELNDVRYRLEIGKGAYSGGRLEPETVDAICVILKDFSGMMKEFGVTDYRACATSAFREIVNPVIVQEQIFQRTGIRVEVLSNAEQHFLGYKSIAAIESGFKKIIQKGTAILDVGGGNLQVSLFDKDALVIEHDQAKKVALCGQNKKPYLTVTMEAPLFGIWSPPGKNAPFICIEPWYGRCDREGYKGELRDREWENVIAPGEVFRAEYQIQIAIGQ